MDSKKGKPVTTSVPSISIKFHANAEQIEELRFSDDDTPNSDEKNHQFGILNPVSSSSDHDTSPLKLLPKLVKRSTSIDVSSQSLSSSPPTDPWRFFSDIKGKITKSVEEKLTEIKARHEDESPSHKAKSEVKQSKEGKQEKDPNNKDSSSFSDSEDQSESSISRTCGFISTTEGVEMSSDDDTPSIDKDKKIHSPGIIRHRFRFLKSHGKGHTKEGSININNLSKLYNINAEKADQVLPEHHEEVESAVDALEEADFKDVTENVASKVSNEEIVEKVTEKISNIVRDQDNVLVIQEVHGEDIKKSYFSSENTMSTVFAPKGFVDVRQSTSVIKNDKTVIPWILLAVYIVLYAVLHNFLPYFAGFLLGLSLSLIVGYIYLKLYSKIDLIESRIRYNNNGTSNILQIPAVKEYQPLTNYEGWVNEYPELYDPSNYHISRTQSVFLRLQGNLLRISHSKTKLPKRAMWNEQIVKPQFTNDRIYNILHAKITLEPKGLTKVRLWSKKYPICITLSEDPMNLDPTVLKAESVDEKEKEDKPEEKPKSPKIKKKFGFKKGYPYMAQRFSKLSENQDIDLDSDSRASTPSPEIWEVVKDEPTAPAPEPEDNHEDEEMHSLPEDWSLGSRSESPSEVKLYLFGRTDREKEEWFRRLTAATHHSEELAVRPADSGKEPEGFLELANIRKEYLKYMIFFNKINFKKPKQDKSDKNSTEKQNFPDHSDPTRAEAQLWLNTLLGRVLFDCMNNPDFSKKVQNRIQKKLQTIRLPYFIEEITITELKFGKMPPYLYNHEKPVLDERGLWVDLDINYEGSIVLTLQTKLNLMRLKNPPGNGKSSKESRSAIYHSDVDDSAESSSDEEGPQELPVIKDPGATAPSHGSKKFIKMVDKIAESKFFQAATENRYIKKAMEGVSNTELRLTVEIKALSGTLVLNIPPPPTDRIWVGFRPVPELMLTACPNVGDINLTYAMVTSWIEKKLLLEFQKVLVIPNMEDILVPVMNSKLPE